VDHPGRPGQRIEAGMAALGWVAVDASAARDADRSRAIPESHQEEVHDSQ